MAAMLVVSTDGIYLCKLCLLYGLSFNLKIIIFAKSQDMATMDALKESGKKWWKWTKRLIFVRFIDWPCPSYCLFICKLQ